MNNIFDNAIKFKYESNQIVCFIYIIKNSDGSWSGAYGLHILAIGLHENTKSEKVFEIKEQALAAIKHGLLRLINSLKTTYNLELTHKKNFDGLTNWLKIQYFQNEVKSLFDLV